MPITNEERKMYLDEFARRADERKNANGDINIEEANLILEEILNE